MGILKFARFFITGIIFGIVLTKAEAVSWYRIYEMFHFQSFHMFGIIGTALFTGVVGLQIIKKKKIKDFKGLPIKIVEKEKGFWRYIFGGTLFGLGISRKLSWTNIYFIRNRNLCCGCSVRWCFIRNLYLWVAKRQFTSLKLGLSNICSNSIVLNFVNLCSI